MGLEWQHLCRHAGYGRTHPNPIKRQKGQKFLANLFSKSFERRRLFKKRRHPETFTVLNHCSQIG
ncbi:hypothetical protein FMA36_08095 [Komagataeibacter xylinus]|uniref:Uncharacterized protein n=1 Tax=Komagataeibacter xylinus TaxID=28448 RepID=A0A857FQJ3_KOMXY|nr:hypothetical protein FMA36_08095 [Komagataeibacter xylinus]